MPGSVRLPQDEEINAAAAYPSPQSSPPEHKCGLLPDEGHDSHCSASTTVLSAGAIIPITSPRFVTRRRSPDADSINEWVKAPALRNLLGIETWQCGGIRPNNKLCRWPLPRKLRPQIDAHADSMLMLHQSSPQLQAKLEKLIDLVHCRHHKWGCAKRIRLGIWTAVFPFGPEQASYGASVGREIAGSFERLTTQCMGTTEENMRCEDDIGGQKVQNCTKTITEISKAEVYLNDISLEHYLRVLALNMCCYDHINQDSSETITAWREKIVAIRERASWNSTQMEKRSTLKSSERQLSNRKPPTIRNTSTNQGQTVSKDSDPKPTPLCASVDCLKNPATHWPNQNDTTPFDIVEKSESRVGNKSSYERIRSWMQRKLVTKDQGHGYVYIYEVEGNKGLLKIGYTTRSIDTRHNEWSFDCNRQLIPLFPIPVTEAVPIPNAYRVGKLCHAELYHRRVFIYCHGCLCIHEEWFEVSLTEAIAVVKKWTAWIRKKPYHQLSLKEEEERKTSDMDRFMEELKHPET